MGKVKRSHFKGKSSRSSNGRLMDQKTKSVNTYAHKDGIQLIRTKSGDVIFSDPNLARLVLLTNAK